MHVANRYEVDVGDYFGPAAHWKGFCDGKLAHNNSTLAAAGTERGVTSIAGYHAVLRE